MCNLNDFSRANLSSLLGGLGSGGSPIENLTPIFVFVFKKSFFFKHYGNL